MANYEATKYDFTGANLTNIDLVNTGLIIPWTDGSVPSGFLECNGAAVSRSTYAALFAVIGTTYGSGNGSTTFNVPDLQNDNAMGKSPNKALASTGGANTVASAGNVGGSTGSHTLSTSEIASHSHSLGSRNAMMVTQPPGPNAGVTAAGPSGGLSTQSAGGGGSHSHNMSATFTGDSTSVVQPYLAVIYIIKT